MSEFDKTIYKSLDELEVGDILEVDGILAKIDRIEINQDKREYLLHLRGVNEPQMVRKMTLPDTESLIIATLK